MTTKPDLYTPWRDLPADVRRRQVGRERELEAVLGSAGAFISGGSPLPVYVFGPRGVGKSHLFTLAHNQLREEAEKADIDLLVIPEDIPAHRSAVELIQRMEDIKTRRTRWRGESGQPATASRRRIVFFEGLDRQLTALGPKGRRRLRQILDQGPETWLAGTGVSLGKELVDPDEAFYGAFAPWPIGALDDEEALSLLEGFTLKEGAPPDPRHDARRKALVALAGGNPRALIALGWAFREAPEQWASDHLHSVLKEFTAHYQMRFRDLSPQAQQMLELLSEAPRELNPGELAKALGISQAQASVLGGRMVDEGVLRRRSEGRRSWYTVAEPLFRHWLEYRTASWEDTRVSWLGRLLEALMGPGELADLWWKGQDRDIGEAARAIFHRDEKAKSEAWGVLFRKGIEAVLNSDRENLRLVLKRIPELGTPLGDYAAFLVAMSMAKGYGPLVDEIAGPNLEKEGTCGALLRFQRRVADKAVAPRTAFGHFLREWPKTRSLWFADEAVLRILGEANPSGRPWKLRPEEKRRLTVIPFIRAAFLQRGRRLSDRPLLQPEDVLGEIHEHAFDLERLLLAATVVRHAELFNKTAEQLLRRGKILDIGICPRPVRSVPGSPDALGDYLAAALEQSPHPDLSSNAISWAATFALLGEETWRALLAQLDAAKPEPPKVNTTCETALAVLAWHHRQRFEDLAMVLGEAWRASVERASTLARDLAEAKHGHLHGELEILRREIQGDAP